MALTSVLVRRCNSYSHLIHEDALAVCCRGVFGMAQLDLECRRFVYLFLNGLFLNGLFFCLIA